MWECSGLEDPTPGFDPVGRVRNYEAIVYVSADCVLECVRITLRGCTELDTILNNTSKIRIGLTSPFSTLKICFLCS